MSAGYSGTPLTKKLGIKVGHRVATFNAPSHFSELIEALPDGALIDGDSEVGIEFDVAVLFVTSERELRARFEEISPRMRKNGGLWVSWPKKSSALATRLHKGRVRSLGLEAGLVDNKICAIDEDWSGLRFVYRVSDR